MTEVNYYTTSEHLNYLSALIGAGVSESDVFQFDLPVPAELDATKKRNWTIEMKQGETWFGIGEVSEANEATNFTTTVWGYALPGQDASYLGPTFRADADRSISVTWMNRLPLDGHLLPIDFNLHMAMPESYGYDQGYVPAVVHLHGGKNRSGSDGLPDQWAVQDNLETGALWAGPVTVYDNDQEAATLWYHDHALGITRLNVYAGLAGFYLLTDDVEQELIDPKGKKTPTLPGTAFEIPIVIQDKAFNKDGQLYFPALDGHFLPGTTEQVEVPEDETFIGDATVMPEFFGNIITVNGMAWPNVYVDEGMWRFRLLNGSDSRFYVLEFEDSDPVDDPEVYLVGTDGGLLPKAIELTDSFVLEPGGRLDLVIDFTGLEGETVTLKNSGPAFEPFKGFDDGGQLAGGVVGANEIETDDNGDPVLVDEVMQFSVDLPNMEGNDALLLADGASLNEDFLWLPLPIEVEANTRKLGLYEGEDEFGRVNPLLGVAQNTTDISGDPVQYGPQAWAEPITEDPELGSKEIWEWYNFTEDAHPIHVHLVQYQVLAKYKILFQDEVDRDGMTGPDAIPDDLTMNGDLDYFELESPPLTEEDEFDWGSDALRNEEGEWLADVFIFKVQEREFKGEPNDQPLDPEYQGWQDTVWVGPGEMVSAVMEFEKPGPYVWHCHILSHEDHEMMRPFEVIDPDMMVA